MKNGEHSIEALSALLDGELTAAERASVEGHVGACGACRRQFEDLRRIASAVKAQPVPALPEGLRERVLAHLHGQHAPTAASEDHFPSGTGTGGTHEPQRRRFGPLRWSAVGGLAATVLFSSLLVFQGLRQAPVSEPALDVGFSSARDTAGAGAGGALKTDAKEAVSVPESPAAREDKDTAKQFEGKVTANLLRQNAAAGKKKAEADELSSLGYLSGSPDRLKVAPEAQSRMADATVAPVPSENERVTARKPVDESAPLQYAPAPQGNQAATGAAGVERRVSEQAAEKNREYADSPVAVAPGTPAPPVPATKEPRPPSSGSVGGVVGGVAGGVPGGVLPETVVVDSVAKRSEMEKHSARCPTTTWLAGQPLVRRVADPAQELQRIQVWARENGGALSPLPGPVTGWRLEVPSAHAASLATLIGLPVPAAGPQTACAAVDLRIETMPAPQPAQPSP